QGTTGRENFLREIGGGVGERRSSGCPCARCGGGRRGVYISDPHEDAVVLIHRQTLTVNQLILEGLQVRVIQMKGQLERAIRQAAAALEHSHRVVEDLLKGHRPPSLCRCGVQQPVWAWVRVCGSSYTAYG